MTNANAHRQYFSLVELLVAVAVLVILMGFLFQFTNGAQRLWSANTARAEMAAQANAVFNLLEQDLDHLYIVTEDEDMDAQATWLCTHKALRNAAAAPALFVSEDDADGSLKPGYTLDDLCFFTQSIDGASNPNQSLIHAVRYHFDISTNAADRDAFGEQNGRLYRFEETGHNWDKIAYLENSGSVLAINGDAGKRLNAPDTYCEVPQKSGGDFEPDANRSEESLLAENIKSIQIYSDLAWDEANNRARTAANDLPLTMRPKMIRISITFFIPEHLRNGGKRDEEIARTFSRVFMLNP